MLETTLLKGGEIVIDLIKKSENVIKVGQITFTNAIPKNASLDEMTGWKKTSVEITGVSGTNLIINSHNKSSLLDISLHINWYYNGRFRGQGRYISNATLNYKINKCDSSISFDLSVCFGSPYNASESEKDVETHLPFTVTIHIIQKQLVFKTYESIYQWTGKIGGEEGIKEGNTVGWYSYKGEWIK